MRKLNRAAPVIAVLIAFACAPTAHAALELSYRLDGGAVTLLPTIPLGSSVVFNGTVGGVFQLDVLTLTSNSPGTAILSELLTSTVKITNKTAATHTLDLWAVDIGFMSPATPPPVRVLSSIGGTVTTPGHADNSVRFDSCIDPGNSQTPCAGGFVVGPGTPDITNAGSFQDDKTAVIATLGTPYSISQSLALTIGGGSSLNFSNTTNITPTPEPTTFLLVGGALFGAATVLRRRRKHV
jgi:hypothetical protein